MYSPGEKAAWGRLKPLDPVPVRKNAGVRFEDGLYKVRSFGMELAVSPETETITGQSEELCALLKKVGYFYNHVVLWHLADSRGIPATGKLVRPAGLKGGGMFFRGSHQLPLESLAARYKGDKEGFLARAGVFAGESAEYADASARLMPVEGLPVYLLLWLEDEEFPARADILLDSAWEMAAPLDIIWCAAMLTILAML